MGIYLNLKPVIKKNNIFTIFNLIIIKNNLTKNRYNHLIKILIK